MRTEYGIADPSDADPPTPPENTDRAAWWKERIKHLWFCPMEVCDGKLFYGNTARPTHTQEASWYIVAPRTNARKAEWKSKPAKPEYARPVPLVFAYPDLSHLLSGNGRILSEMQVDPHPTEGPAETVLLKTDASTEAPRYWIDPNRSFLAMRTEERPGNVFVLEEPRKSPQGIWYPTVTRMISEYENDGQRITLDYTGYSYLDFNVEFPENLFRPIEIEHIERLVR